MNLEERCRNLNHSKMNVSVRFCSACGEIVNRNVQQKSCDSELHSKRRKSRDGYCVDCGKDLKK